MYLNLRNASSVCFTDPVLIRHSAPSFPRLYQMIYQKGSPDSQCSQISAVDGNRAALWGKYCRYVGRGRVVQLQGKLAKISIESRCDCFYNVLGSHQPPMFQAHGGFSVVAAIQEQYFGDVSPGYGLTHPLSRQESCECKPPLSEAAATHNQTSYV